MLNNVKNKTKIRLFGIGREDLGTTDKCIFLTNIATIKRKMNTAGSVVITKEKSTKLKFLH